MLYLYYIFHSCFLVSGFPSFGVIRVDLANTFPDGHSLFDLSHSLSVLMILVVLDNGIQGTLQFMEFLFRLFLFLTFFNCKLFWFSLSHFHDCFYFVLESVWSVVQFLLWLGFQLFPNIVGTRINFA